MSEKLIPFPVPEPYRTSLIHAGQECVEIAHHKSRECYEYDFAMRNLVAVEKAIRKLHGVKA